MANTVTNYLPKLLAIGQMALRERATMPRLVNRNYEAIAAQRGAVINIPIPSAVTATDVTPSITMASNVDFAPTNVAMTLDFWKEATYHMSDRDEQEVAEGVMPMQGSEALRALGNAVNSFILGKHTAIYSGSGTAGTTPFATVITVAASARNLLNKQLAPEDNRSAVLNPDAESNFLTLSNVLQFDQRGDQGGIIRGSIGTKLGFDWYMDQQIPVFTPGTGWASGFIASTVAGAVGDTTLNIINATASGTIVVGDIFTLTADTTLGQQYVVTVGATVSATVQKAISFYPPLKTTVATGATLVVVSVAYDANLAFHRDCFAWASRPFTGVQGHGNAILAAYDPVSGINLRLEFSRQYKQNTMSWDVLGGAAVVRRELGTKIFG